MPVSPETLCTHLDYTGWATHRLLDAAAALAPEELSHDFRTAHSSVLGTLAHLFGADRVWLARIRGGPPEHLAAPPDCGLGPLTLQWQETLESWKAWAAGLSEESVLTRVSYRDLRGNSWISPIWQIVLHVVNHGTHHRGQVSGFLRAMGKTPPVLDLVAYYREKDPSQRP